MPDWRKAIIVELARTVTAAAIVALVVFGLLKAAASRVHLVSWLGAIVIGHFGYSRINEAPVLTVIVERLAPTFELILVSFAIAVVAAACWALLPTRWSKGVANLAMAPRCVPFFWLTIVVQLGVAVQGRLHFGYASSNHFDIVDHLWHLIAPVGLLVFYQLPATVEYFDKSFAASTSRRGALGSSFSGIVLLFAYRLPAVIAATIIVELVFAWPGEGKIYNGALQQGDLRLMVGFVLLSALVVLVLRFVGKVIALVGAPPEIPIEA